MKLPGRAFFDRNWLLAVWLILASVGVGCSPPAWGWEISPTTGHLLVEGRLPQPVAFPMRWKTNDPTVQRIKAVLEFDAPEVSLDELNSFYITAMFDGGRVAINGTVILVVPESDHTQILRWRGAQTTVLPDGLLRANGNRLEIDIPTTVQNSDVYIYRPAIGSTVTLVKRAEWRWFWLKGIEWITLAVSLLLALVMWLIWNHNQRETMYRLCAIAALIWSLRTASLLVEAIPSDWWLVWRSAQHLTSAGSTVALALLALHFAGLSRRWLDRGLIGFACLLPLLTLGSAGTLDRAIGIWGGLATLVVVGGVAVFAAAVAVRRHQSLAAWAILVAFSLIMLAAVHDFLMYWHAPSMYALFPAWTEHGVLLLRYAFSLVLMVFVAVLIQRHLSTLQELDASNQRLTLKLAEQEAELGTQHSRLLVLERLQAATIERHRIMRDLHDGLGAIDPKLEFLNYAA